MSIVSGSRSRAGQGRAGGQGREGGRGRAGQGQALLPDGKEVIRGAASLQSSYTGRLYPPSPC